MLFSGEYDLICSYVGTEYLIGNMTWNGSRGFSKKTKKEEWKIDNKLAGYYTQERNLTYVLINDGSHMVPYDRPIECLDMINRFMQVGNDVVNGKESQVGNRKPTPPPKEEGDKDQEDEKDKGEEKPDKDGKKDSDMKPDEEEYSQDKWSKYYSWGTTTLIFVIIFAATLCCCWCRDSKKLSASASAEFGGAPQREREGVKKPGLFGFIRKLFSSNKPGERNKFRLGDNDESNEL